MGNVAPPLVIGDRSVRPTALFSWRWGVLVALLAAEVVGLTLRFDSGTAVGTLPDLLASFARLGFELLVAAASVGLLLVWSGDSSRAAPTQGGPIPDAGHRPWVFLFAHFVALASFTGLTAAVLEGGSRPLLGAGLLAAAWAGMGLATLVTWVGIGLPPRRWVGLIRRGPGLLLLGAGFGLATWGTGQLAERLWHPLGRTTLWVAYQLLRSMVGTASYRADTFEISAADFRVWVAPECSGYEGMGLALLLTGTYLVIARSRLRFPRALVLLPLAVGAIWLANAVRIAVLVALGSWGFGAVALGGFHSQAGWLAFDAVGLGLVLLAGRWPFILKAAPVRDDVESSSLSSTGAYLAPLLALVTAMMVTGAFSARGSDLGYPVRIVAALVPLWIYRRSYAELGRRVSWEAVGLGALAFVLWVALEPLAPARSAGHSDPTAGLARGWAWAWLAARVAGSVLVVPLAEELAFRAYLTRRLIAPQYWSVPIGAFSWPSFVVSSGLFGLLHGRWLAGTLAGLVYALALYRRRDLCDAVVAHATTNALVAVLVLVTGDWSFWA